MAGRKKSSLCSGQVLLDGKPRPRDFKTRVGYVTQVRTKVSVQKFVCFELKCFVMKLKGELNCTLHAKNLSLKMYLSTFGTNHDFFSQEDVMMSTLTVRENITFSASLRLPSSYNSAARRRKVNEVISELDLEKCADTKVRFIAQSDVIDIAWL